MVAPMREIGSDFYISSDQIHHLKTIEARDLSFEAGLGDSHYLSTGRQAIRLCLQDARIKVRRALLPEYTCASVIQAFQEEGFDLLYYPLDDKLTCAYSDLNRLARDHPVGVLLFHAFFGFDTLKVDAPLSPDLCVICDATQSFFSGIDYPGAHYRVASLRKWGPFLDGGFCGKSQGRFDLKGPFPEDGELVQVMGEAFDLKTRYIEEGQGPKQAYLQLYRQAASLLASRQNFYQMSGQALKSYGATDFEAVAQRRRANYQALWDYPDWDAIGQPLFPLSDRRTVPLYFPFLVKEGGRQALQSFLISRDVYAPLIWPRPVQIPEEALSGPARRLYEHLLVLPIDQRYDCQDMARIKGLLDEYRR